MPQPIAKIIHAAPIDLPFALFDVIGQLCCRLADDPEVALGRHPAHSIIGELLKRCGPRYTVDCSTRMGPACNRESRVMNGLFTRNLLRIGSGWSGAAVDLAPDTASNAFDLAKFLPRLASF